MLGHAGTLLERGLMAGPALHTVDTPVETQSLADTAAAGRTINSGYELFSRRGVTGVSMPGRSSGAASSTMSRCAGP